MPDPNTLIFLIPWPSNQTAFKSDHQWRKEEEEEEGEAEKIPFKHSLYENPRLHIFYTWLLIY